MLPKLRIASVLAVHNRREHTLAALEAVSRLQVPAGASIDVFLLDDGSSDGTPEAVRTRFPRVNIIPGTGHLYWNRGMRISFAEALRHDYDYYLWLNDDTVLNDDAVIALLRTCEGLAAPGIVVGSTCDRTDSRPTYGGVVRSSKWHPFRYRLAITNDKPIKADTMNGNCVLIPRIVAQSVGNLDAAFSHAIGDFDYGLRARRSGFGIWVAPGFAGCCPVNSIQGTWRDDRLNFRTRWNKILDVKGLPAAEWATFARRHGGLLWPIFWVAPYLRLVARHARGTHDRQPL